MDDISASNCVNFQQTNYINNLDGLMDYKVLSGKAVTGLDSYFSDKNQYVL